MTVEDRTPARSKSKGEYLKFKKCLFVKENHKDKHIVRERDSRPVGRTSNIGGHSVIIGAPLKGGASQKGATSMCASYYIFESFFLINSVYLVFRFYSTSYGQKVFFNIIRIKAQAEHI